MGQSTVSEHLRQLAAVGFVLAEDRGTSRLYRINEECLEHFPTAADLVLGSTLHPSRPGPPPAAAPGRHREAATPGRRPGPPAVPDRGRDAH